MPGINPSNVLFFACFATIAIHFQVLQATYYFDDLQAFGGNLDEVPMPTWGSIAAPQQRPLLQLLFSVCSSVSTTPLLLYRINGLLIHLVNGLLLARLVRLVSAQRTTSLNSRTTGNDPSFEKWTGAIVATIWLIHPLGVQTVGSIVQQAESLMATCFIGYLLVIVHVGHRSFYKRVAMAYALLILGTYLKVVMIVAVPAGVLLDALLAGRSIREVLRSHWMVHVPPIVGCLAISAVLVPMLMRAEGGVGFGGDAPPVVIYLMTCTRSFVTYLSLAFWPRELAIDRGPHWITTISQMLPWGLCVLTYSMTACALWLRQFAVPSIDSRLLGWLLWMPLIILAPTSTVIPTADPFFEHRFYLPLVFIVWFIVWFGMRAWEDWFRNQRLFIILGVCFVLVSLSARTFVRSRDFRTLESLWRTALEVDSDNDRAAQNWVLAMQEENRDAEIIPMLNELLRFAKDNQKQHEAVEHQLARAHLREGNLRVAKEILAGLSSKFPSPARLLTDREKREYGERAFDLAVVLFQQNELPQALQAIKYAMQCTPEDPFAFAFAGDISLEMNLPEDAIRFWREAIRKNPDLLPELPEKIKAIEQVAG
jgi:protein O-mannosyl-transferase